ncbi:MAG: FprA family A-type flavoprotein [Candidatus Bathyarchaeota archaeon]|nr:MAG: FprA family A-type flavoprotein [Candidatus Bathyarchaeota archaeon]
MPTVLILYNTKTGNTELMAKAVEEGARSIQGVEVNLVYHAKPVDLQAADAIIIGVPTYNHRMTVDIENLLTRTAVDHISLRGKTAAAFGSYGWSGEAPKHVLEILKRRFEMNILEPPLLSNYKPDDKKLQECRDLGRKVAEAVV